MVRADPDSSLPQPLQRLRDQVQEALSASVHHAALAQQYLAAARKFSQLAEAGDEDYGYFRQQQQGDAGGDCVGYDDATAMQPLAGHLNAAAALAAASDRDGSVTGSGAAVAGPAARSSVAQLEQRFEQLQRQITAPAVHGSCGVGRGVGQGTAEPLVGRAVAAVSERQSSVPGVSSCGGRRGASRRRGKSLQRVLERAQMAAVEEQSSLRLTTDRAGNSARDLSGSQRPLLLELRRNGSSAMASSLVTLMVLLLLGWIQLEIHQPARLSPLIGSSTTADVSELQTEEFVTETTLPEPVDVPETSPAPETMLAEATQPVTQPEVSEPQIRLPDLPASVPAAAAPASAPLSSPGGSAAAAPTRQELLERYGGTAESEEAVARSLVWLAGCQRRDGSWDFPDVGQSSRPGRTQNSIAATAYALMPFLAAGQTHRQGDYRQQVQAGLQHLLRSGRRVPAGLDLRGVLNQQDEDPEPNYAYYTHGAATLVLCESWYRSGDRTLRPACEEAVRFLIASQDPVGGGWRYVPRQPGSTSCTAIQVMALNSARKAGLKIPEHTFRLAQAYFDNVAIDGEGRYGYEVQKKSWQISLTAMALNSRAMLGWGRTDGDLADGVKLLDKRGPYENLYYCYFATQVMKTWGGDEWDRWNERMREELIRTQEREGAENGSWTPRDRASFSVAGGRLLATCLSALTLEVYYRYPGNQSDLQVDAAAVVPLPAGDQGVN